MSPRTRMLFSSWIRLAGICPTPSSSLQTSPFLPLPPKSPELNPVENLWQFLRGNWLSNRVFKSYDDIVNHCCDGESCNASRGASCLSVEEKWASEF
ncbi:hypothetical protein GOE03_31375 [Sinorhizobium medicae]|nr:hypothetical protein [Sinorhizobium medicae]